MQFQVCMIEKYAWGDTDFHFKMGCVDESVIYHLTGFVFEMYNESITLINN